MLRIGLTGGIASGKTTVAAMFAELGAGIVDTDLVARRVVAPGSSGLAAVVHAFGRCVTTESGELDRKALREIVFRDEAQRRRLEAILHPLIRDETLAQVGRLEAPYAVIAVPLLVETDFASLVDRVLVVDCPTELQLERLMRRDRIQRAEAEAMLRAQAERSQRLAAADDVINNSGDLATVREQVNELHRRYLRLARVCRTKEARAE
jgi:dephospho-CoA kinase